MCRGSFHPSKCLTRKGANEDVETAVSWREAPPRDLIRIALNSRCKPPFVSPQGHKNDDPRRAHLAQEQQLLISCSFSSSFLLPTFVCVYIRNLARLRVWHQNLRLVSFIPSLSIDVKSNTFHPHDLIRSGDCDIRDIGFEEFRRLPNSTKAPEIGDPSNIDDGADTLHHTSRSATALTTFVIATGSHTQIIISRLGKLYILPSTCGPSSEVSLFSCHPVADMTWVSFVQT